MKKALAITIALFGAFALNMKGAETFPEIAGSQVSFETNMGSQQVTYLGTDEEGKFRLKLTRARNGQESEIRGEYKASEAGGWWTIWHTSEKGNFALRFKVTQTWPKGFEAEGNVLDGACHTALHGETPFNFRFEKVKPPKEDPEEALERKEKSMEWR